MAIQKAINVLKKSGKSFTTIFNEVITGIEDTSALGVYCYLASKPEEWGICKKQLQNHFKCGVKHINTCFRVLKNLGLLSTHSIRDQSGQITGWQTILYAEFPQNTPEGDSGGEPRIPLKDNVGDAHCGKGTPINKRVLKNKDNIKIKKGGDPEFNSDSIDSNSFATPKDNNSAHKEQPPVICQDENVKISPSALEKTVKAAQAKNLSNEERRDELERETYKDQRGKEAFDLKFKDRKIAYKDLFMSCRLHYHARDKAVTVQLWLKWIQDEHEYKYPCLSPSETTLSEIPTSLRKGYYKNQPETKRAIPDSKKTTEVIQTHRDNAKASQNSKLRAYYVKLKEVLKEDLKYSHAGEFIVAFNNNNLTKQELNILGL